MADETKKRKKGRKKGGTQGGKSNLMSHAKDLLYIVGGVTIGNVVNGVVKDAVVDTATASDKSGKTLMRRAASGTVVAGSGLGLMYYSRKAKSYQREMLMFGAGMTAAGGADLVGEIADTVSASDKNGAAARMLARAAGKPVPAKENGTAGLGQPSYGNEDFSMEFDTNANNDEPRRLSGGEEYSSDAELRELAGMYAHAA